MSNFPLYNSLVKDIPTKDLTVKQKEDFIDKIQNIDNTGRDLVYALIQFYRIENGDVSCDIPYKGVSEKINKNTENLSWTFTDFPIKLRYILYKFIVLHVQNMEEEKARQDNITV